MHLSFHKQMIWEKQSKQGLSTSNQPALAVLSLCHSPSQVKGVSRPQRVEKDRCEELSTDFALLSDPKKALSH